MALPSSVLTNLTAHFDAATNAKVYNTAVFPGGAMSGNCADGDSVAGWQDEGDGISDIALFTGGTISHLKYRSTTPLMLHNCLDYDGSVAGMNIAKDDWSAGRNASDLIGASAFTMCFAFYPESITKNVADWADHMLLNESLGYGGIGLRDTGSAKAIYGYSYPNRIEISGVVATGRSWIVIFKRSATHLKFKLIEDDGTIHTTADVSAGATTLTGINIGAGGFGGDSYDGRIGEFTLHNAELTGTPEDDLIAYMMEKWFGIGGNVPRHWGTVIG